MAGLQIYLSQSINTQPLSSIERAQVYVTLTSKMGMSIEAVAERVGAPVEEIELDLSSLRERQLQSV